MADWGILSGLGAGLQQFGGMISENAKSELEQKLALEREARYEKRMIDRENRQLAQFGREKLEKRNGAWYKVRLNKADEEMDATPASQSDIERLNRDEQKEKASLEKTILDTKRAQAEIDYLPVKYGQEAERHKAQMDQTRAYTDRARRLPESEIRAEKPEKVPLDESLEITLFADRDEDGNIALDKNGKPIIDAEKKAKFIQSQDYRSSPDKNVAATAWAEKDRAATSEALTRSGVPQYAIEDVLQGKPGKVPTRESLPPQGRKMYDQTRQRVTQAEAAVAAGKTTWAEVADKFEAEGYPNLAQELRKRYGIN